MSTDNLPVLKQADATRVAEICQTINLADPALNVTYGTSAMQEISHFADDLLSRVKTKDAGVVGETLSDLMSRIKGVNIDDLNKKSSFISKIPLIGSLFASAENTINQFKTLSQHVDTVTDKLENTMVSLLRDIEILEQLYQRNENFHYELSTYIEAGRKRIAEARNNELPALKAQAEQSNNPLDAQKVRDLSEQINRFEQRLHDLDLSRTITVQTAPQIRLIQSNNQTLTQKIQTSLLATIPIWKNQMVLALTIQTQRDAAKMQKEVTDTTNDLLRKNAEMLQQASIDTARESERSIVDIETLRDVHAKLVNTIEETLKISQEGRQKRLSVERELVDMEQTLKSRLLELSTQKVQASIEAASNKPALK